MLTDLIGKTKGDYKPDLSTVKHELMTNYGSDIIISKSWEESSIVDFRKIGFQVLSGAFYSNKSSDEYEELKRIVIEAARNATLISKDILSEIYKTQKYPPINNFLGNAQSIVP